MDATTALIKNIDDRVADIHTQVGMGIKREQVAAEQAAALLQTFSEVGRIEIAAITKVCSHLQTNAVWSRSQLEAFSACLRANATTRLHQPGSRPMQTSPCLEHYFLQADWDKLMKVKPPVIQETIALRLHGFGMVCLDAGSLKRASAIVQACSGEKATAEDKRQYAQDVRTMLKQLDKDVEGHWPFEYIRKYPRSPFELGDQILDHACGPGVRPVAPPRKFEGSAFQLVVSQIPNKKQRLNLTPRLPQTPAEGALVPVPPQAVAASPGLGGGPFAAMFNALMQAGMEQFGHGQASPPVLKFGPFDRKSSIGSVQSDPSHAATELDGPHALTELGEAEGTGDDELDKFEADLAKSKKAVEEASASDPAGGKIAKRPAAACGKFDIEKWAKDNFDEKEAVELSERRYFVSRLHHRGFRAAKVAGLSDKAAGEARTRISAKAGAFYDLVHKRG